MPSFPLLHRFHRHLQTTSPGLSGGQCLRPLHDHTVHLHLAGHSEIAFGGAWLSATEMELSNGTEGHMMIHVVS